MVTVGMFELQVRELVFARVEAAFSPRKRAGYQTVFRSQGLSSIAVAEIEARIRCFGIHRNQTGVVRLQYFRLADGDIVLTRSLPVYHEEIVDRRRGAFLAHCLVLSPGEFVRVRNDPMWIFDSHGDFVGDAEDMVERFIRPRSAREITTIRVSGARTEQTDWSPYEMGQLLSMALTAGATTRQNRSVLFRGRSEDVTNALRVVFQLLENETLRLDCTFSTHASHCRVPPGQYWAVGAETPPWKPELEVDVAERRVVSGRVGEGKGGRSLYLGWLGESMRRHPGSEVIVRAPTVQMVVAAFERGEKLPREGLSEEACREFHELYPQISEERLGKYFSSFLTRKLTALLTHHLSRRLDGLQLLFAALDPRASFSRRRLTDTIALWIRDAWAAAGAPGPPRLARRDWTCLRELARAARDRQLSHWVATLGRTPALGWRRDRDEALRDMDARTFSSGLALMGQAIEPVHFVSPRHLNALFERIDWAGLSDRSFCELMEAVLKLSASVPKADGLVERARELRRRLALKLQKALQRRVARSVDPLLVAAVDRRCTVSMK